MKILITGGLGYIGSHTCVELLNNDYEVIIIDNLCNSQESIVERIKQITNKNFKLYIGDVRDKSLLNKIFQENEIDSVIHFAGLKSVGESNQMPLDYYDNNLGSMITLLEVMNNYNVKNLVFSSSATVYGDSKIVPVTEELETGKVNCPYGRTKVMIEDILKDLYKSDNKWNIIILRYFNPIGAHPSGLIGESPNGIPNNLLPYITQVASGKLEYLRIFGNDYDTIDGTGVRDYIHVCDLAYGHLCAIKTVKSNSGLKIYNLGTGKGYSVLDVVNAFEKATGIKIKYKIVQRREGDIAISYSDPSKAFKEMNFKATRTLADMCKDQWNWEKRK